jgi:hypothetical protein
MRADYSGCMLNIPDSPEHYFADYNLCGLLRVHQAAVPRKIPLPNDVGIAVA